MADAPRAEALALHLRDQRMLSDPSLAATLDPATGQVGRGGSGAELRIPDAGARSLATPDGPSERLNAGAVSGGAHAMSATSFHKITPAGGKDGPGLLSQGRDAPAGISPGAPGQQQQQPAQPGSSLSPVLKPKSLRAGEHCHHFHLTQSMPSKQVIGANLVSLHYGICKHLQAMYIKQHKHNVHQSLEMSMS